MKIERLHNDIRQALRDADRAGQDASEARKRLAANPDAYRGDKTVDDARKAITEQAAAKVQASRQKAGDAFGAIGSELRYMRRTSTTYNGDAAAAHAWLHRAKPLLDSGSALKEVIEFAVAHDDGDLLAGLHAHIGSHMAAGAGSTTSQQVRFAIAEAVAAVERAQEPYIDEHLSEYRRARRESDALADEAEAIWKKAATEASRDLTGMDNLQAGYAVNAAKRVATGEQVAEPVAPVEPV